MRKLSLISVLMIAISVIGCTSLNELTLDDFRDLLGSGNNTNYYSDEVVPSISIAYPTNNMTVLSTFELLGFAAGEKGIQNVFVFVMKTNATIPTVIPAVLEGDPNSKLVSYRATISVQNNGYFYVWAQLHDKEGEVVNAPQRIVYVSSSVVDTEPPLVSIQSPASGYVGLAGAIQVMGTAYDVSGVSMIYVACGSVTNTVNYAGGSWSTVLNLSDGQKTITAWGKDNQNNTGGYVTRTITLTNAPGQLPSINVYRGATPILNAGAGYNFGSMMTNIAGPWVPFKISNSGNNDLSVSAPQDNSLDYNISNANALVLTPGQSTVFYISFKPKSTGIKNMTVTIINNDSSKNPFTFTNTGQGTNAGGSAAPSIKVYYGGTLINGASYTNNFGSFMTNGGVNVSPHVFKISNAGNAALSVSSTYDDSIYYATGNVTISNLLAGATTNFTVYFKPSISGIHIGKISINNNDVNPFEFYVKATATNAVDGTAPTFTTAPYSTNVTSSGLDIKAKINENGKIYYIVITNNATAPTANQIKAGINYGAVVVKASGNVTASANVLASLTASGLVTGTAYDVYVVAEDNAFNLNTPVKLDITTSGGAQYTMVIDGTKDANWANAFSVMGTNTLAPLDISKFYVANDGANLYVAIDSDNTFTAWNRNLLIYYQIDNTPSAGSPTIAGVESHFGGSDTYDANWKPTGALFFKIGGSETWKGTFARKVNTSGTGWDVIIAGATDKHGVSTDDKFIEGKFDMASMGLTAGKQIKFYLVVTHQWNEYCDSTLPVSFVPDSDVNNVSSHTPVTWTVNYTIR
ncbi:MAG: choice-of-anchor D domain-containing protein [Brevinematales bacterium]|nr:choice-of-anchor D domain-containing protein [Brevinematales bacterium]